MSGVLAKPERPLATLWHDPSKLGYLLVDWVALHCTLATKVAQEAGLLFFQMVSRDLESDEVWNDRAVAARQAARTIVRRFILEFDFFKIVLIGLLVITEF